jgi:tungstate transport system substrate-binding protein
MRSSIAPHVRRAARFLLAATVVLSLAACSTPTAPKPATTATPQTSELVLASTTSTQDSGLFDVLIPAFEKANPLYKVKVIAVGTGEALKLGQQKDADVLLVHSKTQELQFMKDGFGTDRKDVMYNDFLIVGPKDDPAAVKAAKDTTAAMLAIKKAGEDGRTVWVSRADKSGTNTKELGLWKLAGVTPTPTAAADKWYVETGQGMGASLTVASEKGAYILTDRATYLANKANLQLDILNEGDNSLLNVYHVITVNPDKWPRVNYEGAMAFAQFITSAGTQKVIADFGIDKFGQPLFYPDANKTDADLGL